MPLCALSHAVLICDRRLPRKPTFHKDQKSVTCVGSPNMADKDKHGVTKNVNVERRTWDKETYSARAASRVAAGGEDGVDEEDPAYAKANRVKKLQDAKSTEEFFKSADATAAGPSGSSRAYLTARKEGVDITSKVGTSELIVEGSDVQITDGVTKSASGVGWYCKVCDCFLKDSLGYLDHINGKKHQRALGYTMRVEQSTVGDVKSKLKALKEAKAGSVVVNSNKSVKEVEKEKKKEESAAEKMLREEEAKKARRWEERKRKKEDAKRKREEEEAEEEGGMDPDMAAMMGFGGFGK